MSVLGNQPPFPTHGRLLLAGPITLIVLSSVGLVVSLATVVSGGYWRKAGETQPTQAQNAADAYVTAFQTQATKMLTLRNLVSTKCAAGDRKPCVNGILDMAVAARDAAGALPTAPGCMSAADSKVRVALSQIEHVPSASLAAPATESEAHIQAASSAVKAGAYQLLAAGRDVGNAKC